MSLQIAMITVLGSSLWVARRSQSAYVVLHSSTSMNHKGLSDFLVDQDRYWPISNNIRENLGPVEHAALRRTSRQHAMAINEAQKVYHDINKHLANFVSDPIAFRCLQAKYNALITAPFSTQFMTLAFSKVNGEVKTDVLTMMFEKNTGENDMAQLLITDKYELQPRSSHVPKEAQYFVKKGEDGRFTRVVLIFLPCPPIYSLLKSVGMTGDANFITWNKAYALFAHATFNSKENYLLQSLSDLPGIFNDPDTDLKLKHLDEPWFETPSITGTRAIADRHTMKETLDTTGIWPSKMPDYVLESAKFKLKPVRITRWEQMKYYSMQTSQLNHPVLRYPHLHLGSYADKDTKEFIKWFEERLNHVTRTELMKIPLSQQTDTVLRVINNPKNAQESRGRFPLPETWNFVDNKVIEKFKQFENSGKY